MDIKVVRIFKLTGEGVLKAFVDLEIAGSILIKGIRIVNGSKGLFVAMPSEQGQDGKWYRRVSITDETLREQVNTTILEAYERN